MNFRYLIALCVAAAANMAGAQTLEKMNWFNEPSDWKVADGKLIMYGGLS